MTTYEQGFVDKCAELGVDPGVLVKTAARGDMLLKAIKAMGYATHSPINGVPVRSLLQRAYDSGTAAERLSLAGTRRVPSMMEKLKAFISRKSAPVARLQPKGRRASLLGLTSNDFYDVVPSLREIHNKYNKTVLRPPRKAKQMPGLSKTIAFIDGLD
jgi:hypothetical protein